MLKSFSVQNCIKWQLIFVVVVRFLLQLFWHVTSYQLEVSFTGEIIHSKQCVLVSCWRCDMSPQHFTDFVSRMTQKADNLITTLSR